MEVKKNILLTPGPATTTDSVKQAQVVPDICPREKEFEEVMQHVRQDLVKIVNGDENYTSILFGGSGTAVMDACINSVVPPGKKIAIVNNGAYGERMVKIAEAYGISCVEIASPWGEMPDLTRIENEVKKDKDVSCLAMIHHETTTGMLNPVKQVAQIARKNDCVFIVDAISSYAGIPIDINDLGVDFLLSTSNKCIQGMAGLAFVICRKSELERTKSYPARSFYLNLYQQFDCFERTEQMRFTPPVQVIYALRQAIAEYFQEGGIKRWNRYSENWETLRSGLDEIGFEFLLKPEQESRLLTSVLAPNHPEYDFKKMHDLLYERGFTIYPGKILSDDTFRIANIGDINSNDIKAFIESLKAVLAEMEINLSVDRGSG